MLRARVVSHAVATTKHRSLTGWRLLVVQPVAADGATPDGEPLLVLDHLGAGRGAWVMISNDGQGARELVGDANSPARWFVLGICDT
jgi:ethanolamine utilization protein EutN